jgi:hypothetical protein
MHEYVFRALGISLLAATAQAAAWQELPPVDQLPVIQDLPDPFVFNDGSRVKTREDWAALLDFADKVFFGKAVTRKFDQLTEPDMEKAFSWSAPM